MGCVCVYVCVPTHLTPASEEPALSLQRLGGPRDAISSSSLLLAAANTNRAHSRPGLGRWSGPTPPSHPLGQLPVEPGARYQASAGQTPDSSCWLALGLQPSLPTGAGRSLGSRASELSSLAPSSHLALRPLRCWLGREAPG